jgi:Uncharacterized conserved protein
MLVNIVSITIKSEFRAQFESVTLYNHENTRREAGNVRFDVLHSATEPDKYVLYEVFANRDAVEFHKTTEHYKRWSSEMEQYMAAPRSKESFTELAFN